MTDNETNCLPTVLITVLDGSVDYSANKGEAHVVLVDFDALKQQHIFPVDVDLVINRVRDLPPLPWRADVLRTLLDLRRQAQERLIQQDIEILEGAPWLS